MKRKLCLPMLSFSAADFIQLIDLVEGSAVETLLEGGLEGVDFGLESHPHES